MKLSIVIVSYNVRHYLDLCLQSVAKALEGIDGTEVFVVDNASSDDTMRVLPQRYPWVKFIANDQNLGSAEPRHHRCGIHATRGCQLHGCPSAGWRSRREDAQRGWHGSS